MNKDPENREVAKGGNEGPASRSLAVFVEYELQWLAVHHTSYPYPGISVIRRSFGWAVVFCPLGRV